MSTLEVSNLNDGTTTLATTFVTNGSSKVWARVDQSGQTLQDSYNVSSITDGGTGFTSLNLTSAFSSANWCVNVCANSVSDNSHAGDASTVRGGAMNSSGTRGDASRFHMSADGDLA
jgi:hypothetical protein